MNFQPIKMLYCSQSPHSMMMRPLEDFDFPKTISIKIQTCTLTIDFSEIYKGEDASNLIIMPKREIQHPCHRLIMV